MQACLSIQRRKRKRFRLLLSFLSALVLCGSVQQAAAQTPFETLLSLLHEARYDEARAFAASIAGNEKVRENNLALVEAIIHKRERRFEKAADEFSALLDRDPSFTRVRQELAHTLYLMGDDDRARYHFEFLKSTVDNASLRAAYDTFLVAIRKRRPWSLSASIGFAPSTNINDGTPDSTVYIAGVPFTNENAAKSGVGFSYNLSGSYRFDLTDQWSWTLGGGFSGASYTESHFDRLRLRGFSELSTDIGNWRVGAGISAERMFTGWRGYSNAAGPYLSARTHLGKRGSLEGRLSWAKRNYDVVDAYNGSETDLVLLYRHIMSPRLAITIGTSGRMVKTTRSFTSYASVQPSLSLDYLFNKHLILHGRASYEHRVYRSDFPLTGEPRRDNSFTLGAGATLRGLSFKGYVPQINYEYHQSRSNVALFDRDRHSVGIAITKKY